MTPTNSDSPGLTPLGKLILLLFLGGCVAGAWQLIQRGNGGDAASTAGPSSNGSGNPNGNPSANVKATIRIAYGTEKKRWLAWAAEEFAKTPAGAGITLELLPFGSLEGARAAVDPKQSINVWTPASAAFKEVFVQEWQLQRNSNPILREEPLALSPMVFVLWKGGFFF
jgi:hypothetical protein